jgi:hypothetical protein
MGFVTEIKRDASYKVDITFHYFIRNWVIESYMVEVNKENSKVSYNF